MSRLQYFYAVDTGKKVISRFRWKRDRDNFVLSDTSPDLFTISAIHPAVRFARRKYGETWPAEGAPFDE